MEKAEIIVIGAGATGLMVARELAKAGKKVIILEAIDRVGGRIFPLDEEEFGYPAQGGAEFIHGEAPLTKSLLREAGLNYVSMPEDGEMWSFDGNELKKAYLFTEDPEFIKYREIINERLNELVDDIPISTFLEKYFSDEKYSRLVNVINNMVKGFDAADPHKISTFSLKEEWLGQTEWKQGRIKEGYGPMINFLVSECKKYSVELLTNKEVKSVKIDNDTINVLCTDGNLYNGQRVIVTVALPIIKNIKFSPTIHEKIEAIDKIGFGQVIKILIKFKDQWWTSNSQHKNINKMVFMLCNGKVNAWWTQYPEQYPVLTGWIAGPEAEKLKHESEKEIFNLCLSSLSDIWKADKDFIKEKVVTYQVVNWPADPFTKGAYSYSMANSEKAYAKLREPVENKIFFAGEALYKETETATVEGALASGLEVARQIIHF